MENCGKAEASGEWKMVNCSAEQKMNNYWTAGRPWWIEKQGSCSWNDGGTTGYRLGGLSLRLLKVFQLIQAMKSID